MIGLKMNRSFLIGLLAMAVVALSLAGCGSDSYDDPAVETYQGDASAQTLVEAATVRTWVDNGCVLPETGQRMVVLDCVPNPAGVFPYSDTDSWFAGDKTKVLVNIEKQYGKLSPQYKAFSNMPENLFGHIPGAIPNVSHEGYEVTNRDDGPMLSEHEVGTGSLIDQMLQQYGITKDDVIVLTTSRYDYPGFCSARLWWTLRYWGFPKENIRVLNGGNKAYAMAGNPLQKGVTLPAINPSNISVADFPQRFLDERISIGELISLVDSGRTTLADEDPDKVIVLDTRQPPAAYYFKDGDADNIPDVFQVAGYAYDPAKKLFNNGTLTLSEFLFDRDDDPATGLNIPFSATTNPPIDLTAAPASSYLAIHGINGGPLAIPLGAKPAAFEGIVRGAKITKTPTYNITVPALTLPNGAYKTKEALLPVFDAAGIDGSTPVVVYCNSGALAAIYYYALKEICGFENVRLYDGSWQEWANLTAFEPADTTYVMNDDYAAFPSYPAPSPSVVFFAGQNKYFTYDPATDEFKDSQSGAVITDPIKAGGSLAGKPTWDTITRSQYVMFRPTATVQGAALDLNGTDNYRNKTYNGVTDWPAMRTTPGYIGDANRIRQEDEAYQGAAPSSGGEAPSAFIPKGGGC